jgi:hypothetical protein
MRPRIAFVGGSIVLAASLGALWGPEGLISAPLSQWGQAQAAPVALPAVQPIGATDAAQSPAVSGSLANFPTLRVDAPADLPVQSMANRLQVNFRHGLLSIRARDATINDVLRAVGNAMGVTADLPDTGDERVSVQLGPGEPAAVLTALLNGLPYDSILVGSQRPSRPIARIMLMSRSDSRGQQTLVSNHRAPSQALGADKAPAKAAPQPNLEELKRQQDLQFQQQFGTCIAQRCDDS